jgi:ParD-like antitoxin of type II bacterial toxin-antitoxin system
MAKRIAIRHAKKRSAGAVAAEKVLGSHSGVTIKVSSTLYTAAKEGAERSHRSVPKQVEYWSALGRVLDEVGVSQKDLVHAANAMRLRFRSSPSRATELFQELLGFFEAPPRGVEAEFAALTEAGKGPVYGTSPEYPGKLIQRLPDGTELVGALQDGNFVPERAVAVATVAPRPRQYASSAGR